ncbi:hypothetical protein L208DRAFT_1426591 [Tricholoma matsutake]|nr:hypothetical protein L208DRAFT_1426591 [Tricholoma matsutake 945]
MWHWQALSLDQEQLETTGSEVSTLSEQLKGTFGWNSRSTGDGIVPITEVFEQFFAKYPHDNVLKKWIIDVAKGAEKVYVMFGIPSNQGRKPDDLVSHLTTKGTGADGKPWWAYIASDFIKHAIQFPNLYKEATWSASGGSLGSQLGLHEHDTPATTSSQAASEHEPSETLMSSMYVDHKPEQGKLDKAVFVAAGKKAKAEELKAFNAEVNHIIMHLITAAFVPEKQISLLKKEHNLTLTFDGTTICKPESFYVAHAMTPQQKSFLLDANQGNGE